MHTPIAVWRPEWIKDGKFSVRAIARFKSEPSPTSTHACGEVTGCAPAAKRSACVASEVDLEECTLHSPTQKANKAEPTLALNPRGDVTRNPNQGYQWPQKRTCVRQKL